MPIIHPVVFFTVLSGLLLGGAVETVSQERPGERAATTSASAGNLTFENYQLENGLTVILAPNAGATASAVNLWYRVGSRNERPGRSGFAHLFEHLMFQGSEGVPAGEHMRLVERAGGNLNASITEDRTNYYQTVPPERVNLALWLEADRMRSLQITEESLRREVEVVKEERRLRVDNSPYGTTQLQASYYAAYDSASCFPYAHSVIGSMEDLNAAQLPDVQDFFDLYYAPANATLTVTGRFDSGQVRQLIQEYFGAIPMGDAPPQVECEDPFPHLPHSMELVDPNATLPAYTSVWGGVAVSHPDGPAITLLTSVLGGGESSRLHRRLVRETQVAQSYSLTPQLRLGPGLVRFFAVANQGVEPERIGEVLEEEVQRVREGGITAQELDRARRRVLASRLRQRQTAMGQAEALQSANHFHGSPERLNEEVDVFQAVTPDDVQRVAASYLAPGNKLEIITRTGGGGGQ
ncbi:MAG: pitrilysin family protein [Gemmatimonadota bacterium]